jgi:hypothetical protein
LKQGIRPGHDRTILVPQICLHLNEKTIGPGAQTSRPIDAGPVKDLCGGMTLTGRFFPFP